MKRFYTVAEFMEAYGIGKTKVYREAQAGRLRIVKIGAASRIAVDDAEAWAGSLPEKQAA
jgi:excisionase family DNA binding protein